MDKKQASKIQVGLLRINFGLSVSTVSVVLNGRGDQVRISKETQKKVLNAAKEINYQPNIYARRLRQAANEEAPYVLALFWRPGGQILELTSRASWKASFRQLI